MKHNQLNPRLLAAAALTIAALVSPAEAGITVDNSKIVSGSATGTLAAIDVPYTTLNPTFGGPDWTTSPPAGVIPHIVDNGFTAPVAANDGIRDQDGTSKWEPDGTPLGEAKAYFTYGNGPAPSVKWTFSAAASGIDLPEGSVIWGIYATWNTRNTDGITYHYSEGAQSGSIIRQTAGAAPTADLVLSWTDDLSTVRNANFERLFEEPIVVADGNGFELWGTDNIGNAAHIDAVVIDYQLPTSDPIIIDLSPEKDATEVVITTDLVATFDEDMTLVDGGVITIKDLDTPAQVQITLPNGQVSASGRYLTINPSSNLTLGKNYAIQISNDAIKDSEDNFFAGILDDTTWNFQTTADNVAPTISSTDPADGATDLYPFSRNLVETFDEDVKFTGTGTVTLRNLTLGSGSDVVFNLPSSRVTIAGDTLTIDPSSNLDSLTDYAVQISADAIVDLVDNPFAGVLDDTTWNFTTAGLAGGVAVDAGTIQNAVTPSGDLVIIDPPKTSGDDGSAAGIGFAGSTGGDHTGIGWEPGGTDNNNQWNTPWKNGGSVTYTFNLPDGAVINKVYHDWKGQGNQSATVNYAYDEGTPTSVSKNHKVAPVSDLVLQWTAADSSTHNVNFETIFTGPITVAGGDGFTVTVSNGLMALGSMLLDVSPSGAGNTYGDWIAGYPGVGGQTGIGDDPDGDGNENGLENFFGTAPDTFTQGLVSGAVDTGANTFTFTHPLNATPADDLTATYRWSTDLQTFYNDGDPNGAGTTTVDFVQGTPSGGMVTVTATISGTVMPDELFVDVLVTQP